MSLHQTSPHLSHRSRSHRQAKHRPLQESALLRTLLLLFTAGVVTLGSAMPEVRAGQAPELLSLEMEFLRTAPEIIKLLRKKGVQSIGVLKFQIDKDGYDRKDNVGTLNTYAADRLLLALALENPNHPDQQLRLVRDASLVASQIKDAGFGNRKSRKNLFQGNYPPAWGDPKITIVPEMFVSGIIKVDPDLRNIQVVVTTIDQNGDVDPLLAFKAKLDGEKLNEVDVPFVLRSAFENGNIVTTEESPLSSALSIQQTNAAHPLQTSEKDPFRVSVFYDDVPVKIEYRNGRAFVQEPEPGQKVILEIARLTGHERFGVVAKVNGENTIGHETMRDFECSKWILSDESPIVRIQGYYDLRNLNRFAAFRVAAPEESVAKETLFGTDTGTISISLFPELPEPVRPPRTDQEIDIAAMLQGAFPDKVPEDAVQLKAALRTGVEGVATRGGLILPGNEEASNVTAVPFNASPNAVLSASIRYYTPQNR